VYRVTFVSSLFAADQHDQRESQETLSLLLECLVRMNERILRSQNVPLLYESGVRYEPERLGQENWQDCAITWKRGRGDCEDLASWRAAELRVKSKLDAKCIYTWRKLPNGVLMYHIKVEYTTADGQRREEDPSRRLGMNAAAA